MIGLQHQMATGSTPSFGEFPTDIIYTKFDAVVYTVLVNKTKKSFGGEGAGTFNLSAIDSIGNNRYDPTR